MSSWLVRSTPSSMLRHGLHPRQTPPKGKTVFDLSNVVFNPERAKNLPQTSLNKLRCIYSGHVICDVTGLLKMIS